MRQSVVVVVSIDLLNIPYYTANVAFIVNRAKYTKKQLYRKKQTFTI